jgi:hypothetical protein
MNRIRVLFLSCCSLFCAKNMIAQKKDSLSLFRDFAAISTNYKQLPLYLQLEIKNATNIITSEEDTSDINGEFYLRNENSYVRVGEFEQVVNDSMALLVSDKLQQMILYPNASPVVNTMKSMMGFALPDSSIKALAATHKAVTRNLSDASSMIELQSRTVLFGTDLSREAIQLQYDVSKKIPQQVTTLKRSLMRIDSAQYIKLKEEPGYSDKLLSIEESYFVVKEQTTTYFFKQIENASATIKVPVLITDRIMKNEEGEYVPVKNYEGYRLTKSE